MCPVEQQKKKKKNAFRQNYINAITTKNITELDKIYIERVAVRFVYAMAEQHQCT